MALLRQLWDMLMICIVFKPFARQPLQDSCIARKISGPDMRNTHFHVVDPVIPMMLLRIALERQELSLMSQNFKRRIDVSPCNVQYSLDITVM